MVPFDRLAARKLPNTGSEDALALARQALDLAGLAAAAAGYAGAGRAPNTQRAYRSDWASFADWCAAHALDALPAESATVALYLTALAPGRKLATLRRRLACIGQAHAAAGHANPCRGQAVRAVWRGIARAHGEPPVRKTPLVVEAMRAVLATLDDTPRGRRDRALLLIGWGGALRRGELVALDRRDVAAVAEGLIVTVRRGKTQAPGEVRVVGIPRGSRDEHCPAASWAAWCACIPDRAVPAFRQVYPLGDVSSIRLCDRTVARIVKRVCRLAGLQGDYSGHSLRAGLATAAAAAGASERAIMAQTGHRNLLIARSYIRPASLFADNAAAIAAL